MNRKFWIVAAAFMAACSLAWLQPLAACSTFVLEHRGKVLFGRNFDFLTGVGYLMVNPRGVDKSALVMPGVTPAAWTALYGSVTFNQVGRDFPMGGMNEKGLVVECMWLAAGEYPAGDERPAMTELQWMQYLLDTCQSIPDVKENESRVRILPGNNKLHFLVCDRSGAAAVIEFIGGKLHWYESSKLPAKALTNTPYEGCIQDLKGFPRRVRSWKDDHERFALLARGVGRRFSVARAFELLELAHYDGAESPTQWRVVYDPTRLEVHLCTRSNANVRSLRLGGLDFDCRAAAGMVDLDGEGEGDMTKRMSPYSPEANMELARRTFAIWKSAGFNTDMNDFIVGLIGAHPQTNRCR